MLEGSGVWKLLMAVVFFAASLAATSIYAHAMGQHRHTIRHLLLITAAVAIVAWSYCELAR